MRLSDYEDEEAAPEKWNCFRNNDPSVTHLILQPAPNQVPSFYQNLATALQYNTNITRLQIDLKFSLTKECMELLTTFLSANVDNQMLKLILQRTIGTEAASNISDELFPSNSIKELHLRIVLDCVPAATFRPLLEAIGTIGSLESLHIDLYQFDHKVINLIASLKKILFYNKKLKKLYLEMNDIELQDLENIAFAIQKLPSLEAFLLDASIRNLSNNVIIEDVIKKRFPMISKKYNLTCKVIGNYLLVSSSRPMIG